MAERETKTIGTPGGHNVVLRTYLTGREASGIKSDMLKAMRMSIPDTAAGKVSIENVSGEFLVDQEHKTLGYLVVSVDDVRENALDLLLDLPSDDYKAVLDAVNEITNPSTPSK